MGCWQQHPIFFVLSGSKNAVPQMLTGLTIYHF